MVVLLYRAWVHIVIRYMHTACAEFTTKIAALPPSPSQPRKANLALRTETLFFEQVTPEVLAKQVICSHLSQPQPQLVRTDKQPALSCIQLLLALQLRTFLIPIRGRKSFSLFNSNLVQGNAAYPAKGTKTTDKGYQLAIYKGYINDPGTICGILPAITVIDKTPARTN